MNRILTRFVIVLAAVGIAGCSTNTQQQNTGIGAVSGAVLGGLAGSLVGSGTGTVVAVGVGAIGGALLGGYIGHNMDSTDTTQTYNTLDTAPTGQPVHWMNSRTGASYTVTPTTGPMAFHGYKYCRRFVTTVTMKSGEPRNVHGVACRMSDGTWKAVK